MATFHRFPSSTDSDRPVDLSRRDTLKELTPAAVKAFLKMQELWDVRDQDARILLGGMSNGSFYEWKRKAPAVLDQDRITRISLLTGIFKALNILYGKKLADHWVQLPNQNAMFEGGTPLSYMMRGGLPAILRVRQLLDSRRSGR